MKLRLAACLLTSTLCALPAGAQGASVPPGNLFTVSNVYLLYGWNFTEPDIDDSVPKNVITFENTSARNWWSNYLFVDVTRSWNDADANAKEVYAEWYPSVSLRTVFGDGPSKGLLRDVRAVVGLNTGVRSTGPAPFVVLPGVAFDFNVPAFAFLSLGTYAYIDRGRFEGHLTGCKSTTFLVSPAWSIPFRIASAGITFDGFADLTGAHGECAAQFLTQPRLRFDLSRLWHKPGAVLLGVAWTYWHNKYGIPGLTDSVPLPVFTWSF